MKRYFHVSHPAMLVVLLLLLMTASLVWGAASRAQPVDAGPARTGYDPLSPAEQRVAQETALQDGRVQALLAGARRTELLLVERHEESKEVYQRNDTWPRRADVLIYDYDQDTLVQAIVNLRTRAADQVDTSRSVQPPLTDHETATALNLALADPQAATRLREGYRQSTGQELVQPEQIAASAFIFLGDAISSAAASPLVACRVHRCAQLVITTPDHTLVDDSLIVDLSSAAVVQSDH